MDEHGGVAISDADRLRIVLDLSRESDEQKSPSGPWVEASIMSSMGLKAGGKTHLFRDVVQWLKVTEVITTPYPNWRFNRERASAVVEELRAKIDSPRPGDDDYPATLGAQREAITELRLQYVGQQVQVDIAEGAAADSTRLARRAIAVSLAAFLLAAAQVIWAIIGSVVKG